MNSEDAGGIEMSDDFVAQLADRGGGGIAVFDADGARAERGLLLALERLAAIPHPLEPTEGLVKFISRVSTTANGGIGAWFDAPDMSARAVAQDVAATLQSALAEVGVAGRLEAINTDLLAERVVGDPEPWTGDVVPDWLPIPPEAVDVESHFFEGNGFVIYWVPSSADLLTFYGSALPGAGFTAGAMSTSVRGELPSGEIVTAVNLEFQGRGRLCKLESAFRDRVSPDNSDVVELKVHVRCDLT